MGELQRIIGKEETSEEKTALDKAQEILDKAENVDLIIESTKPRPRP